jgi:hypothetical protein
MSAFGTKKPGSDAEIQLGFPEVFAANYAASGMDLREMPEPHGMPMVMPVGNDIQDQYHAQKMRDAHYMAGAKVQSTTAMNRRAEAAHCGYFGMPKPLLTQRHFANPSNGNQSDIYPGRRDQGGPFNCVSASGGGSLHGGVLRTAQGQRFGKQNLLNRIGQFDAIKAAKEQLLMGMPIGDVNGEPTRQSGDELLETPTGELIDLDLAIQAISDAMESGIENINRFVLTDFGAAIRMLLRVAPTASKAELDQLNAKLGVIAKQYVPGIRADIDNQRELPTPSNNTAMAESLCFLVTKVYQYVHRMLGAVNRPTKERIILSKALVKDLGLTSIGRLPKNLTTRRGLEDVEDAADERGPNGGPPPEGGDEDGNDDDDNDFARRDREDQERGRELLERDRQENERIAQRRALQEEEDRRYGSNSSSSSISINVPPPRSLTGKPRSLIENLSPEIQTMFFNEISSGLPEVFARRALSLPAPQQRGERGRPLEEGEDEEELLTEGLSPLFSSRERTRGVSSSSAAIPVVADEEEEEEEEEKSSSDEEEESSSSASSSTPKLAYSRTASSAVATTERDKKEIAAFGKATKGISNRAKILYAEAISNKSIPATAAYSSASKHNVDALVLGHRKDEGYDKLALRRPPPIVIEPPSSGTLGASKGQWKSGYGTLVFLDPIAKESWEETYGDEFDGKQLISDLRRPYRKFVTKWEDIKQADNPSTSSQRRAEREAAAKEEEEEEEEEKPKKKGKGHASSERSYASRGGYDAPTVPASHDAKTFSAKPLPSVKENQLESLQLHKVSPQQVKFDRDEVNTFGKKAGAYIGEKLPENSKNPNAPFARTLRDLKDNGMKPLAAPPTPSFVSNPVSNPNPVASASLMPPTAVVPPVAGKGRKRTIKWVKASERALEKYTGFDHGKETVENGIPKSRAELPTSREGYVALANYMTKLGHHMRVNKDSNIKNIRLNFIRKLKL